ncbi:MAG: hypothetical protein ACREPV_11365 [Lysobacter sp.]
MSVATFSFFTFVSPYLPGITGVNVHWLGLGMLVFGLCSIAVTALARV